MNRKLLIGVGFSILALITLMPAAASKSNRLGFYSVCAFAPISTAILFILSSTFWKIGIKESKRQRHSEMTKIVVNNEALLQNS
jgi:predicted membrane channel-forming protein YqfA (hemolysin III family)